MKKIIYSILLCSLSVVANLSQAQSTNDNGTTLTQISSPKLNFNNPK